MKIWYFCTYQIKLSNLSAFTDEQNEDEIFIDFIYGWTCRVHVKKGAKQ